MGKRDEMTIAKRTVFGALILSTIVGFSIQNCFAQLAADYAHEEWTCNQENSDTGAYTDLNGVTHPTNPLGHPEYLNAGRACDFRAIFSHTGVPYGWGHWHTISEFNSYITAGRGAGNHGVHGSAPNWATGIDCSGLLSRCWNQPQKRHSSWFGNSANTYRIPRWDVRYDDVLYIVGHVRWVEGGNETNVHGYEATGDRVQRYEDGYGNYVLRRRGQDTAAPTITNININPNPFSPNGDEIEDESTLRFTVTDTQCGAVSIRLLIDGQLVHTFPNTCLDGVRLPYNSTNYTENFEWTWDRRIDGAMVEDGEHPLTIEVTDLNENQTENTDYSFLVDRTPPIINWIEFYENISQRREYADKLYGLVDIRPNADDQGSGIRRITSRIYETWSIDHLLWTMFITYQISFQQLLSLIDLHQLGIVYENEIRYDIPNYPPFPWDTTKWPEDFQYILEVEVEDFDGNIATTHELLKVDNNAPYLDIVEVYQENLFSKEKSKVKSLGLENLSNQNLLSNLEIQKIAHKLDEDLAGYEQEYCADWIDIDEDSRSLKIHKKEPLLRGVKTKFSLYFSQPIETTYLSAFICPRYNFNKRIELKLYPLDSYGKFFRKNSVRPLLPLRIFKKHL